MGAHSSVFKTGGGEPAQVVVAQEDDKFQIDEEALSKVLLHPDIKDKHVVVISIAGAFRKGKSFLLNFFLRYMRENYSPVKVDREVATWLGGVIRSLPEGMEEPLFNALWYFLSIPLPATENSPLFGFSWRGGSNRVTTGILLWSEAFVATLRTGEEVAIVLMDTQGTFDQESTFKESTNVFAISTFLSSVQIYNLFNNIQEDDLTNLEVFTQYGKLAAKDLGDKPFQKLIFLVRDWSWIQDAEYGEEGGRKLISKILKIEKNRLPTHQAIRRNITDCFTDIRCFLLPHPGMKVATDPNFDGRLKNIEPEFVKNLKSLVSFVLSPENLVVKEIGGHRVKAEDLFGYFQSFMKRLNRDDMPVPMSMLEATAEGCNLRAAAAAKETYCEMMEEECGPKQPYLSADRFDNVHQSAMVRALDVFSKKPKIGGDELSLPHRKQLALDLNKRCEDFRKRNEDKSFLGKVANVEAHTLTWVASLLTLNTFTRIFNKERSYRATQGFIYNNLLRPVGIGGMMLGRVVLGAKNYFRR